MSEGAIDFKLVPMNSSEQPDVTLEKRLVDHMQKRTNPQDFIRLASSQSNDTPSVPSNALRQLFRQKYRGDELKRSHEPVQGKKSRRSIRS